MNYVTSDNHFCHDGIIHICNRPFIDRKHMERELIKNYNSIVTKDDTCYFLGDVFWGKHWQELRTILSKMNGTKILILGNHCECDPFDYVKAGFQSVHTYLKVEEFNLIHDPAVATVKRNEPWICGHLHSVKGSCRHLNFYDCGVDGNNYKPISFDEIREYFK